MAENKTKATKAGVTAFLNKIKDKQVRDDCFAIAALMQEVSKLEPAMWGSAIVGFGTYHYVYASGREGDTVMTDFSPRKKNISVYRAGCLDQVEGELSRLGKHETGKGCQYIRSLGDVDRKVLKKILVRSFQEARRRNAPTG